MSGELASSFQTAKGDVGSTEASNGKGFGTETDLTFTAAGELDNGFTVDMLMGIDTAGTLANSSSQVTLGMGSLGALRLNHIGGSSANAIDDVTPNHTKKYGMDFLMEVILHSLVIKIVLDQLNTDLLLTIMRV